MHVHHDTCRALSTADTCRCPATCGEALDTCQHMKIHAELSIRADTCEYKLHMQYTQIHTQLSMLVETCEYTLNLGPTHADTVPLRSPYAQRHACTHSAP